MKIGGETMGIFDREVRNSFDRMFDLNRDGVLDPIEQGLQIDFLSDESDEDDKTDETDDLDFDELEELDEDERIEALEEAEYDLDDFDNDFDNF